jgi:hypothetical protein
MNWLVATESRCEQPAVVSSVRMFVVQAETEAGVRAELEASQPNQMIRWMRPEQGPAR